VNKAFRNDVVVVPRLNEAFPSSILVLPLVMVEAPRDVVLWPRVMEEFPMQILVLPLLMVVLPSDRAVLPSVMLVLPIGEEMAAEAQVKVVVVLVVVVVVVWRRQSLELTQRGASDTHAALARGSAFPPNLVSGMASGGLAGSGAECLRPGSSVAAPVSYNAFVERRDVGRGRPHTTHVSP